MQTKLVRDKGAIGLKAPPAKRRAPVAPAPVANSNADDDDDVIIVPSRPAPVVAPHRYFYGRYPRPAHADPKCRVDPALFFLSNFASSIIIIGGKGYATVEHYYQSQKFMPAHPVLAERIRTAVNARAAKFIAGQAGAAMARADWRSVNIEVMRTALVAKFQQNEPLREKLLATAGSALHEDAPGDMFWGSLGQDWLGKLLTEIRDQMIAQKIAEREADAIIDLDYWQD